MNKTNHIGYRPTLAQISLDNLAYNFRQIKKLLAPGVKVMACVKADAYGHGLVPLSKKLVACGADYLGVASLDEAIKLRQNRISAPVLVLGLVLEKDIKPLLLYNIIPTICSEEILRALSKANQIKRRPVKVHIKVDTGMGRIGVPYPKAAQFIRKAQGFKGIQIEGVFTHLACADIDADFTRRQIAQFKDLSNQLRSMDMRIPFFHLANSLGIINYPDSHFNMVRPGLIMYGLYPKPGLKIKLKPVLSLKTKVVYHKRLPAGSPISYGHTYHTKNESTIVTLPIGYGDGYPRSLSNLGPVLIKGKRFRISGRVCMDQIMVDVGDLSVRAGQEAVLIGSQGKSVITAEELAQLCGTIPYEIVCGLGSRISRVYT